MKKLRLVLAVLVFMLALVATGIVQAINPLRGATEYDFVALLGEVDDEGRVLNWEGTISGDITGTIQWWGEPDTPTTGQVFHFIERWEIWDGEVLLMAGEDKGTTTIRHGKNTIWRTNGIVTDADEEFETWIGRHVHMGGDVTWQVIQTPDGPLTIPDFGSGIFRVN